MEASSPNRPSLTDLASGTVYPLDAVTIIGRHEDCDLVLMSERGASRKHARVLIEDNRSILMDLGSLNGTLVNGHEIAKAVQLVDGDIIIFDQQEYRFNEATQTSVDSSENLTVVANKDEINNPEKIKPAIRVVDEYDDVMQSSFDETEATEIPVALSDANQSQSNESQSNNQQSRNQHSNERQQNEKRENERTFYERTDEESTPHNRHSNVDDQFPFDEPIAATSRPGGSPPIQKRRQVPNNYQNDYQYADHEKPKSSWLRWVLMVPFLLILLVGALYVAYNAGVSSGAASSSSSQ